MKIIIKYLAMAIIGGFVCYAINTFKRKHTFCE